MDQIKLTVDEQGADESKKYTPYIWDMYEKQIFCFSILLRYTWNLRWVRHVRKKIIIFSDRYNYIDLRWREISRTVHPTLVWAVPTTNCNTISDPGSGSKYILAVLYCKESQKYCAIHSREKVKSKCSILPCTPAKVDLTCHWSVEYSLLPHRSSFHDYSEYTNCLWRPRIKWWIFRHSLARSQICFHLLIFFCKFIVWWLNITNMWLLILIFYRFHLLPDVI